MSFDVIVVGAGPAGGSVARELGRKGYDVLVIEEDNEVGEPVQCAGIVSNRTIKEAGVKDATLNKVKGAYFYSPNGDDFEINGGEVKAHVIDRAVFDKRLVNEAISEGCDLSLNTKAVSWNQKELIVEGEQGKKSFFPDLVVGADGVKSCIRSCVSDKWPRYFLPGAQVLVEGVDVRDTDFVEIFLGNNYAPGFFGWFIPISEDKGRLGLCVKQGFNPLQYLEKLRDNHPVVKERLRGEEVEYNFGAVPIGFMEKTFFKKTLLVGDACGFAKPTTGGGVYTGIKGGKIAAEACDLFLDKGVPLSFFQEKWKNEFGGELNRGMVFHKIWSELNDEKINDLFKSLKKSGLREIIEEKGDIDYQSKVFFDIIKNEPRLLRYGISYLKNYIKEFFF